jgi:hypothetical protein
MSKYEGRFEPDEKFFRRVRRERESTPVDSGIRLKIPRNRYIRVRRIGEVA